jgi:hypothetical protein
MMMGGETTLDVRIGIVTGMIMEMTSMNDITTNDIEKEAAVAIEVTEKTKLTGTRNRDIIIVTINHTTMTTTALMSLVGRGMILLMNAEARVAIAIEIKMKKFLAIVGEKIQARIEIDNLIIKTKKCTRQRRKVMG